MSRVTPEQIDALLPQTQCGLCTYQGCMPYAEAICFEQAPINLCPPGGVATLKKLGELTEQSVEEYLAEMHAKEKPRMTAIIREAECIGCTKCIVACPVDAILGAGKAMHTVISDECTGCELCVAPCPVDCIDMVALEKLSEEEQQTKANHTRKRYYAHTQRITLEKQDKDRAQDSISLANNKQYIADALARVKNKKRI
jgi:electron transport complex protein RnfB